MKFLKRFLLLSLWVAGAATAREPDYSRAIHLDAEALAEQGMAEAYARVLPGLKSHAARPLVLSEKVDSTAGAYEVQAGDLRYRIFPSPLGGGEQESWGVATAALFDIVNRQLAGAPVRFYALNAGNDLMGIFLTELEAAAARKATPRRADWPYLPTMHAPWFGQFH